MSEKHKHTPVAWATRLYNTAYHAGHHDTVEGCYTHVYPQDMGSYHEDVVQEWLADNPQPTEQQPAPAVQGELVAFCEDAALSIAERTFSTEVDERLASDIIQYAQRLHSLYTAPKPAPDVAGPVEALQNLTAMVDAAMVEMKNIIPPLRRSECERLIRAALAAHRKQGGDV